METKVFKTSGSYKIILEWDGEERVYANFKILNEYDQLQLSGDTKWDGCMNISGHYHFCVERHIEDLAIMLKTIRKESEILLKENGMYTQF